MSPLVCVVVMCGVTLSGAESMPSSSSSESTYPQTVAGEQATGSAQTEPVSDANSQVPLRFKWKGTLAQSGLLLGIQHSLRMVQENTRVHLGGPFWRDYRTSVAGLRGWNDGNPIITKYVGHPMMGAITGFIQIQNDPGGIGLEWEPRSSSYWTSRFKALGWATLYSTSCELAPWGEAGIGNVGYDRGTMGYVDLVITPLGGFGMMLLEDYLDRKVIQKVERGKRHTQARVLRVILNPQRSIANALRFKRPSHRDTRGLVH